MNYETVTRVKIVLAVLLGLFLLVRSGARARPADGTSARPRRLRARVPLLAALALVSLANYFHYGYFHTRYNDYGWLDGRAFVHLGDVYRSYLGAKYFDELGYGDLYVASVVADAGDGGRLGGVTRVRNLDGNGRVTREKILARAPSIKARFTPGRWRDFTADVRYFTERLPPSLLAKLLVDRGSNPTPAWHATAGFVANRVPVDRLFPLALIDVALLLACAAAIAAGFGVETALVATVFFGINAFTEFSITGGSFLRYDWLLGLVAGACLLRRRHYAGAGLCLSYAAFINVFPALFLAGLAGKAAVETVRDRAVPPRFARLFLSFVVGAALFAGYGCLSGRGVDAWRQFAGRIAAHHRTLTANSVGFPMAFLYDGTCADADCFAGAYGSTGLEGDTLFNRAKTLEARERRTAYLISCAAVLALCALVVSGRPDGEALAWGAAPVFMLLNLGDSYYVFLIVAAAAWYRGAGRRPLPLLLLVAAQVLVLWIRLTNGFALRAAALASLAFFAMLLSLLCYELLLNRHRIRQQLARMRPASPQPPP